MQINEIVGNKGDSMKCRKLECELSLLEDVHDWGVSSIAFGGWNGYVMNATALDEVKHTFADALSQAVLDEVEQQIIRIKKELKDLSYEQ